MKEIVEAKLQQAEEQRSIAQEQVIRWDAAVQVYRDLLAEMTAVVPVVLAE